MTCFNYQAKILICLTGLEVKRMHTCPNDCILTCSIKRSSKCFNCAPSRYKCKNRMDKVYDVIKNEPSAKML